MRVPAEIRNGLNERARFVGTDSVGCEVRFVTSCPNPDVHFSFSKPEFSAKAEVRVFRGNFQTMVFEASPGVVHSLRLIEPAPFGNLKRERADSCGFSSNVWRVCMNRGGTCVFHGVDAHGHSIRPPMPEEKPKLKWLAYGSSITNSSLDGYPHFAARLLKVDVMNLGFSGACQCEKILADWMSDVCQWDFATCELGVNMRGGFTPDEFGKRVQYLLGAMAKRHPEKPVVAINIFPNVLSEGWTSKPDWHEAQNEKAFNQIVRDVVKEIGMPNLHLVEGDEVMTEFTGLSGDLIHPCSFGHAVMGANLASALKRTLKL